MNTQQKNKTANRIPSGIPLWIPSIESCSVSFWNFSQDSFRNYSRYSSQVQFRNSFGDFSQSYSRKSFWGSFIGLLMNLISFPSWFSLVILFWISSSDVAQESPMDFSWTFMILSWISPRISSGIYSGITARDFFRDLFRDSSRGSFHFSIE